MTTPPELNTTPEYFGVDTDAPAWGSSTTNKLDPNGSEWLRTTNAVIAPGTLIYSHCGRCGKRTDHRYTGHSLICLECEKAGILPPECTGRRAK